MDHQGAAAGSQFAVAVGGLPDCVPGPMEAHCHIAEHHESGMMFSFEVAS